MEKEMQFQLEPIRLRIFNDKNSSECMTFQSGFSTVLENDYRTRAF